MTDLLSKIRKRSFQDRRIIALTISGLIVAIVFLIWANAFRSEISQNTATGTLANEEVSQEQKASVIESMKKKARLLFGEGSPLRDVDLGLGEPIEYKKDGAASSTEYSPERDLQAILEAFSASSSDRLATTSEEGNSDNSL